MLVTYFLNLVFCNKIENSILSWREVDNKFFCYEMSSLRLSFDNVVFVWAVLVIPMVERTVELITYHFLDWLQFHFRRNFIVLYHRSDLMSRRCLYGILLRTCVCLALNGGAVFAEEDSRRAGVILSWPEYQYSNVSNGCVGIMEIKRRRSLRPGWSLLHAGLVLCGWKW